MYLATLEDEDGIWFADPIAADTREDAERIAKKMWPSPSPEHAIMLYACSWVCELDSSEKETTND